LTAYIKQSSNKLKTNTDQIPITGGGGGRPGGATRPLPRDGTWRNFTEIRKSNHALGSKKEKVETKNSMPKRFS